MQRGGTQPHRHPSPSHKLPSPPAGDLGPSRRMANSTQGGGGLPSAELWASHNRMVMEPLDSNDPEVRAPSWPLPSSCYIHPPDSRGDADLLKPGMWQGDGPRLSWWDPSTLCARSACRERGRGRASSNHLQIAWS